MIHHFLDDVGIPVGWSLIAAGTLMTWLYDHGMGVFGVGLGCFGAWIQWETYQLRKRALEARLSRKPSPELD